MAEKKQVYWNGASGESCDDHDDHHNPCLIEEVEGEVGGIDEEEGALN